jgi:hypothetical protein
MAGSSRSTYDVVLSEQARDAWYCAEPRGLRRSLWRTLKALAEEPRPPGALQLVGSNRYWLIADAAVLLYAIDEEAGCVFVTEIRV